MGTPAQVIMGTLSSQCVTRCLFAVYTLHISGKPVWSQFNRKFDLLYWCNHETTDGLLPSSNKIFMNQHFIVTQVSEKHDSVLWKEHVCNFSWLSVLISVLLCQSSGVWLEGCTTKTQHSFTELVPDELCEVNLKAARELRRGINVWKIQEHPGSCLVICGLWGSEVAFISDHGFLGMNCCLWISSN